MSYNTRTGRLSRKIMTIAAAVFAVALMIAVPVLGAVDTDAAEIKEDKAGFKIVATDPTDEDLAAYSAYGLHSKMYYMEDSCSVFMSIFDLGFLVPTIDAKGYEIVSSTGVKIKSDSFKEIDDEEFSAKEIEMVYTFNAAGDLIVPFILNSEYEKAADAIKGYFGNEVKDGDSLKITGTVKTKLATETKLDFAAVDDDHSVIKGGSAGGYFVNDIDVTIEFIKNGSSAGKIYYRADDKYSVERELIYDYGKVDYKDITDATPLTIKSDVATFNFESGSTRYTVDGTDYKIGHTSTYSPIETHADVRANSDWNLDVYHTSLDTMPVSTADGKVTADKSYDAAEAAFDGVVADVVVDDILKVILIGVGIFIGIIVLIVILIVVILVLKKKKRQ